MFCFIFIFGLLIYRNIHYRFAWASRYSAIPSWVAKRIKPLTVEQVGFWLFWKLIFKFSSEARSNLDGQTWWECRSINLNKVKDAFFAVTKKKTSQELQMLLSVTLYCHELRFSIVWGFSCSRKCTSLILAKCPISTNYKKMSKIVKRNVKIGKIVIVFAFSLVS